MLVTLKIPLVFPLWSMGGGEVFLVNQEYNINLWQKSKPRIRKPINYVILLLFLLITISNLNFKLGLIFFLSFFISLLMFFRSLFSKPILV